MFVKRCCVYHFFASGSQEGEWNLRENDEKKWLSLTRATKVGVSWSGKEQLHKLCAVDCSVQVDHARCWSCGYFAFAAINQKVKNNMEREGEAWKAFCFFFADNATLASRRLLLQQKFNEVIKSTCGVLPVDQAGWCWSDGPLKRTNDLIQRSLQYPATIERFTAAGELDELSPNSSAKQQRKKKIQITFP